MRASIEPGTYRDMLQGNNLPCWILSQWRGPEDCGSRTLWPYDLLGEFPSRGMYEDVQPFYRKVMAGGKLVIQHMPLNYSSLEMIVPFVQEVQRTPIWKRKLAIAENNLREEAIVTKKIADILQNASPAWEAASFGGQRNKNSVLRQKMDQIERNLSNKATIRRLARLPKKFAVG